MTGIQFDGKIGFVGSKKKYIKIFVLKHYNRKRENFCTKIEKNAPQKHFPNTHKKSITRIKYINVIIKKKDKNIMK